MNFYKTLDLIMRQDIGGRGLLPSLPASPLAETAAALSGAKRAVLLTGFPVRLADGSFIGETDGPSGTAAAAAALNGIGCHTAVVTDSASYPLLKEALRWMAPQTSLVLLPKTIPLPLSGIFSVISDRLISSAWNAPEKRRTAITTICAVKLSTI